MASAWGTSWGTSWASSWGGVSAPSAKYPGPAGAAGGKKGKRRWARIGDKAIYATPKELQAHYEYIVATAVGEEATAPPPVKVREATGNTAPAVSAPVVVPKIEYRGVDFKALWQELVLQNEMASADALARVLQARILRDRMLEADDEEVLILMGAI